MNLDEAIQIKNIHSLVAFDVNGFLREKVLTLVQFVGDDPLTIIVRIEQDNTDYEFFDGTNEYQEMKIVLDSIDEITPDTLLTTGRGTVTIDTKNADLVIHYGAVTIETPRITLQDGDLKETYGDDDG